jgi:hypothetical protein
METVIINEKGTSRHCLRRNGYGETTYTEFSVVYTKVVWIEGVKFLWGTRYLSDNSPILKYPQLIEAVSGIPAVFTSGQLPLDENIEKIYENIKIAKKKKEEFRQLAYNCVFKNSYYLELWEIHFLLF